MQYDVQIDNFLTKLSSSNQNEVPVMPSDIIHLTSHWESNDCVVYTDWVVATSLNNMQHYVGSDFDTISRKRKVM